MMVKFVKYMLLALLLTGGTAQADGKLSVVQATGQVVMNGRSIDELRLLALEDALYLAALKGNARVDGYSSVDYGSTLTEHYVVRPASKILDYNLISEGVKGDYYTVVIEAVTGELQLGCFQDTNHTVHVFRPEIKLDHNVPAWSNQIIEQVLERLIVKLGSEGTMDVVNETHLELNVARLRRVDQSLDYGTIMNSSFVRDSDFAILPHITIKMEKKNFGYVSQTKHLQLLIDFEIMNSSNYEAMFTETFSMDIDRGFETYLDTVNMMLAPQVHNIIDSMVRSIDVFAEKLAYRLSCTPISGVVKLQNGELVVDFGDKKGLDTSHLAFISDSENKWTVLRVVETTAYKATLMPLDPTRSGEELVGKRVRFLEVNQ